MSELVVVITGASTGIGAALAQRLARDGTSLALIARRADALHEVAARCGAHALPIVADVTIRSDVRRALEETIERFGHVDVWVNNVGQGITRMPSELTDDDLDEMMRVNVKSALYGMQEVLPHFKARGRGQVINVSSMLGRMPFAVFRSAYNGVEALSERADRQLPQRGLRVRTQTFSSRSSHRASCSPSSACGRGTADWTRGRCRRVRRRRKWPRSSRA